MPSPAIARRRLLAAFAATSVLAACAGLGGPRTFTLGEADLQRLLDKHFPATRPLAGVAEVTVSAPSVWLMPERNRLGTRFDVRLAERLFGQSVHGRVALDCALRLEPADDSIRLTQVRVQQLDLDAGGGSVAPLGQRVGALLAEHWLEDLPLYKLKPEQAERLHASGLRATAITVTSRGVEVTLGPG